MTAHPTKPDFVCIGPEKTATTWLYSVLSSHREVWLPPVKELRFLNEGELIPRHSLRNLLFSDHWHYAGLRSEMAQAARRLRPVPSGQTGRGHEFRWTLRYCLGRRSFGWYASLFPADRVSGDISPRYYELSEATIVRLKEHNPRTKILLFVRNPIDRIWSKALMVLCRQRKRNPSEVPADEFTRFFDTAFQEWTPYLDTIELWRQYFEVFVGFYDDLSADAGHFFSEVCQFLGVADESANMGDLGRRVYGGIGAERPESFTRYLLDQYRPEIEGLSDAGVAWADEWLKPK